MHGHADLMAGEQSQGLSLAFSSSPSSHFPPFSSLSLTSHSNCSPGSHYCSISLFIFPFESLPPAKTVIFLAPRLGVSNLQLGSWRLQGPNSMGKGREKYRVTARVPRPDWPKSGPEERGAASRAGGTVLGSLLGHGEDCVYENVFLLLSV